MTDSEILKNFFDNLKEEIISNHIRAGQKATGKTIQSFQIEIEEASARLTARGDIGSLEKGTAKGTKVGLGALVEWIEAKGIQTKNVNSLAFLIQRKIMREGSRLFRDGGRKDIITSAITDEKVGVIEKQFADKYLNLVKTEIKQAFA